MNKLWTVPVLSLAFTCGQMVASSSAMAYNFFRAYLSGEEEIVTNPDGSFSPIPNDSNARGVADLKLNDSRDELSYRFEIFGLDLSFLEQGTQNPDAFPVTEVDAPDNTVTQLHFHNAPAGANGPVVFSPASLLASGFDDLDDLKFENNNDKGSTIVSGIWDVNDPRPLTPGLVDELLSGNLYLNVHTVGIPGGEIRGQIEKVPEPTATLGLMLAGSIGMILARRKSLIS
ncbi:MAG: CHRD domain-containing protein [Symploca sp. SIO3C6]|uniref:CHRD domain-containing protein n=1 Tax=Symploca sp. SIO1C4 TaxID=2607765 RepID=A0A6B3NH55_9CYAN|nr:CHRD domain-containing protein [Symploca sp. SIO3C6]NER28971.1 CHRD domain-containing protein [Symploca sp. SIO1C4]NET07546.1 CHRD domain-containing protein [Symploca sp. SIO2B6]